MKVVAIDYGTRRIGMAVSDDSGTLALALGLEERRGSEPVAAVADRVAAAVRDAGAREAVVGLPRHMDGGASGMTRAAREFVRLLQERLEIPVRTWDERLTSHEAERRLRDVPMGRARKRGRVNVVAAQVILEEYLRRSRGPGGPDSV